MLIISKFLLKYKNHSAVESTFQGLRPAVVGLLAAAALLLMNEENFGSRSETPWQFWISVGLFLFAMIAHRIYKTNPILIILLCGITGMLLF
jgi:chromate transporter